MMPNNMVSVIMPTYNRRHIVGRAIDSVYAQSLQPIEIIVVDDGSTDGTGVWLRNAYPLIKFIELTKNRGAAHARNVAIELAKGEIIAFLDSDDWWEPEFLDIAVNMLYMNPSAVMAVSDVNMVLEDTGDQYIHHSLTCDQYRDMIEHLLMKNFITTMSSIAVRKNAIQSAGLLNENFMVVHDRDWYIRLCQYGGIVSTGRPLVWRYIANDNLVADLDRYFNDCIRYWKYFFYSPLGLTYRDIRFSVLSESYRTFSNMSLSREKTWAASRYRLQAFIVSFMDGSPDWDSLFRAVQIPYEEFRKFISRILKSIRIVF